MKLDLTALTNAVARLREALVIYQRDPSQALVRDALIQRFEFTYEISHKLLRRTLQAEAPSPEQYDGIGFADLIRSGSEQGLLLGGWPRWRQFREMRSRTSHSYDEAIAVEVAAGIADFLREAEYLRDRIGARGA
jgi:nucleotidyltransferase substrate binding protein (TIGR01987 family)